MQCKVIAKIKKVQLLHHNVFATNSLGLSSLRSDSKLVRYGRSRSFKVIGTGTNRKPVCDFLLVFCCNMFFCRF